LRLAKLFACEVPAFLVGRELLNPDLAEQLLPWRYTGFSVHSRVRVKAKPDAERPHSSHLNVLDSIRSRNYHLYALGGIDSEPKGSETRPMQESNFLYWFSSI
jgi:hypothetical protein